MNAGCSAHVAFHSKNVPSERSCDFRVTFYNLFLLLLSGVLQLHTPLVALSLPRHRCTSGQTTVNWRSNSTTRWFSAEMTGITMLCITKHTSHQPLLGLMCLCHCSGCVPVYMCLAITVTHQAADTVDLLPGDDSLLLVLIMLHVPLLTTMKASRHTLCCEVTMRRYAHR